MQMGRRSLLLGFLLAAACVEAPPAAPRLPILADLGESEWSAVTTGRDHTCGLTRDGRAFCWGSNNVGQLGLPGDGPSTCQVSPLVAPRSCSPTPQPVLPSVRFVSISAGGNHTCAVAVDGAVHCWGDNDAGQLGAATPAPGAVRIPSTPPFASVSAGATHSCAVRTDGALFCWGRNDRGQLGTGDEQPSALPLRVTGNLVAASVSAGDGRTCTRTVTSAVFCWGAIWLYRQNGLEFTRDQPTPERVTGTRMFSSVSAGSLATCAADGIGALYCWEANPYGQMGTGGFDGSTSPLPVATRARFETVSAGIIQTCAIAVDGTGYCWGDNTFGQLGVSPGAVLEHCLDGSLNCATRPMPVYGRQQLVSISTGLGNHSCAVSTHGNLYCWGLNWLGELGTGRATYREVIPVLVSPLPVP